MDTQFRWKRDLLLIFAGLLVGFLAGRTLLFGPESPGTPPRPPATSREPEIAHPPPKRHAEPAADARATEEAAHPGKKSDVVRITGHVTDADGGPAPGAAIVASGDRGETEVGKSGAGGKYEVEVPKDTKNVRAQRGRMVSFAIGPLDSKAFGEGEVVDLRLLYAGRDITVTVHEPFGGPVAGARVSAFATSPLPNDRRATDAEAAERGIRDGRTDADGHVVLSDVSPLALGVIARAKGYSRARGKVAAGDGPDEVDLVVARGVTIKGQVKGFVGRLRGRWMVVALGRGSTRGFIPPDGKYEIDGVPAGPLYLRLWKFSRQGRKVVDSFNTTAKGGETVRWDPVVKALPTIRGHVVDLGSNPLEGWTVSAVDARGSDIGGVQTDAHGSFRLTVPKKGAYTLSVVPLHGNLAVARMTGVESGTDRLRIVCDDALGVFVVPVQPNGFEHVGELWVGTVPVKIQSATAPPQAGAYAMGGLGKSGEARSSRLPLGTYRAFLVAQEHGVVSLGELTLSSAGTHTEASCSLPEPGRLLVHFAKAKPRAFRVEAKAPGKSSTVIWSRFLEAEKPLTLFPGTYVVVDTRVSPPRGVRVEIESGQTQEVHLP